jgi:hypothetical protein
MHKIIVGNREDVEEGCKGACVFEILMCDCSWSVITVVERRSSVFPLMIVVPSI